MTCSGKRYHSAQKFEIVVWLAREPAVYAASFQLLGVADKLHSNTERELKGHTFILHPKPVLPQGAHIQLFSSLTRTHMGVCKHWTGLEYWNDLRLSTHIILTMRKTLRMCICPTRAFFCVCVPCLAGMDGNPVQSCSVGSAKDNPITIEDASEVESPVKISKRAEYTGK